MKKVIFALTLFLFAGVAVNAQSKSCCSKKEQASCCAKKASTTKTAAVDFKAADELAAVDENIERRECAVSGKISYFQKSEESGEVVWEEVSYDADKKTFTRVAAASMEKDPETGKVMEEKKCAKKGKSCCAKKGKA